MTQAGGGASILRMRTIASNTAKQTFGQLLEAAQQEPVLIERRRQPAAVILSVSEYDRLTHPAPRRTRAPEEGELPRTLPALPKKAGLPTPRLTAAEMVALVHAAEADVDA